MSFYNIRQTIAKELGIYNEYNELKELSREIEKVKKRMDAKHFELYSLYIYSMPKEDAYRKAQEDTEYFFKQLCGEKEYEEFKRTEKYVLGRMSLISHLIS
jgi:hypothetical protein